MNDVNYAIQKSPTLKPLIVHIDRLMKYRFKGEGTADGYVPPVWRKFLAKPKVDDQEQDVPVERTVDNEEMRSTPMQVDTSIVSDGQVLVNRQELNPPADITQSLIDGAVQVTSSTTLTPSSSTKSHPLFQP